MGLKKTKNYKDFLAKIYNMKIQPVICKPRPATARRANARDWKPQK